MTKKHINPVFIGHGSPMNALASNAYTEFLKGYAASIPEPEAIVVISAHWQTKGSRITGHPMPQQIFDFYGFPETLYTISYSPEGSAKTAALLTDKNKDITNDMERGIDHAAWAVVKHMYPEQNIPLLEMSLDLDKSEAEHLKFGENLSPFCDQGILFIGSGNIVHNLRDISHDEKEKPFQWATEADAWLAETIENGNYSALTAYKKNFSLWQKAIPTTEHFLPLLFILGMAGEHKKAKSIYNEIQNGSISMRCVEITDK